METVIGDDAVAVADGDGVKLDVWLMDGGLAIILAESCALGMKSVAAACLESAGADGTRLDRC